MLVQGIEVVPGTHRDGAGNPVDLEPLLAPLEAEHTHRARAVGDTRVHEPRVGGLRDQLHPVAVRPPDDLADLGGGPRPGDERGAAHRVAEHCALVALESLVGKEDLPGSESLAQLQHGLGVRELSPVHRLSPLPSQPRR